MVGAASGSSTRVITSHGRVHLTNRDERVGQDRWQPEDSQGDRDVTKPDADDRGEQEHERDLGHRAPGVAEADREVLALADVAQHEADRHGHRQRTAQGDRGDLELSAGERPDV